MGQTLTHGIYLPDEGERNCYNGLAANWQLLDGAVGTVAEHTTALAGKAPAVHTHTKSDVTDLFNSANTWTESQTYSKTTISNAAEVLHCKNTNVALGETPTSDYQKLFMFKDKNNDNFGYYRHLYQTTGSSQFDILVRNKFTNGAPDTSGSIDYLSFSLRLNADKSKEGVLMGSFKPSNTNTYDLGSSSYQWNNLYAKNYYYNGTAWGLDKSNTWSNENKYTSGFILSNISWSGVTPPSSAKATVIEFKNSDTRQGRYINRIGVASAETWIETIRNVDANTSHNFTVIFQVDNSGNKKLLPYNSDADLGQSTSNSTGRWKTLNGINPGALSLPSATSQSIDTTEWVTNSWSPNYCDAPFDGYISIACFANSLQINNETKSYGMTFQPGDDGFVIGLMPVCSGDHIKVAFVKTQTSLYEGYKFIKANGNV